MSNTSFKPGEPVADGCLDAIHGAFGGCGLGPGLGAHLGLDGAGL